VDVEGAAGCAKKVHPEQRQHGFNFSDLWMRPLKTTLVISTEGTNVTGGGGKVGKQKKPHLSTRLFPFP
jgi:hypothetical protein